MAERQRKIIYINGKFLTQKLTGVQRCATEIVKALDKMAADLPCELVLLTPKRTIRELPLRHMEVRHCGYLQGTLWEQLELPFYARSGCLMNLCNCAPLVKRCQAVILHDVSFMAVPEAYGVCYTLWHRFMSWWLGRLLPLIFTDSAFSKTELEKRLKIPSEKIRVVHLGANHMEDIVLNDTILAELGVERGSYVLAVSSQSVHKNFRLVLEAAGQLPERKFVIVGQSNPAIFRSEAFVTVPGNVVFSGYVDDCRLAALYRYAACFVFPSIYEGFGLPPLEAMFYGTPVIAANAASLPEVLGGGAFFIDPHSAEQLAEAIDIVTGDTALREKLAANALRQCRRYEWYSTARQIMEGMVGFLC